MTYADLALVVTWIKRKMEPPNLDCLKFENMECPLILFLFGKICINAVNFKNKSVSTGINYGLVRVWSPNFCWICSKKLLWMWPIHYECWHFQSIARYLVNCLYSQFYHERSILKSWSPHPFVNVKFRLKILVNLEVFFRIDFCFNTFVCTDMILEHLFEFISIEKMQNKFQDNIFFDFS